VLNSPRAPTLHQNRLARLSRRQTKLSSRPPERHLTPLGDKRLPIVLLHHHRLADSTLSPGATCRHWSVPLL